MINNDKAFASLEREIEHCPFEIFQFDSSGYHHSRRTKAYQYAETLIRQYIGIGRPKRKRKTKKDDLQKTYSAEHIAIAEQILDEVEQEENNPTKPGIHDAIQSVNIQDNPEQMTKCKQCGRLSPRDFKNCYYCNSNLSPVLQGSFFSKLLARFK